MDEDKIEVVSDALSNIPGIGPARRAALQAAGITTRAALAQASVEQIISLTGMPRSQAERTLETLHTTEVPMISAASPQIQTASPPTDEAIPTAPPPLLSSDDDTLDPSAETLGLLDNAAFRAKTALADATRLWTFPKVSKSLERLAVVLDTVIEEAAQVRPRVVKRLTSHLKDFAAWIEKSAAEGKPLSEKRRERVRRRLKSERAEIESEIRAALRRQIRQSNRSTRAVKIVSQEPKREQKRTKKK